MSVIYNEIYKIVQSIPKGRVLTYGLISHMIGGRMSAQGVGWALKALGNAKRADRNSVNATAKSTATSAEKSPAKKNAKLAKEKTFDMNSVPWQRVVNAQGGTSTHKVAEVPPGLQQHLLEGEGIPFDEEGKLDLDKYLWWEGIAAKQRSTEVTGRIDLILRRTASRPRDKQHKA